MTDLEALRENLVEEVTHLANVAGAQGEALGAIRDLAAQGRESLRQGLANTADPLLQQIWERASLLALPAGLRANQESETTK